MAAPKPLRKARIVRAFGFEEAFRKKNADCPRFAHPTLPSILTTDLGLALEKFVESKSQRPPTQMLASFKDHHLTGKLSEYKECHLQGDVLLIYTDKDDTVSLLIIANHDELYGPREDALLKRLKAAQDTITRKPWKKGASPSEIRTTLLRNRATRPEIDRLLDDLKGFLTEEERTTLIDYRDRLPKS